MNLTNTIETEYANITEIKKTEIEYDTKSVSELYNLFQKWFYDHKNIWHVVHDIFDRKIMKETYLKRDYTPQDITGLCLKMQDFSKEYGFEYCGIFLTTLIENHFEKTKQKEPYLIITENLPPVEYLCEGLDGPNVIINGNVGQEFCSQLKNGKIILNGSCGEKVCQDMINGEVYINGSTKKFAGLHMQNGTLIVEGNTDERCGSETYGGYILIKGNTKDLVGVRKRGGTIVITGDSGYGTGWEMSGGLLVIKGNTEENIGGCMLKGTIIIEGNCKKQIGAYATGGTIIIDGEIESISNNTFQTKIIQKGKILRP